MLSVVLVPLRERENRCTNQEYRLKYEFKCACCTRVYSFEFGYCKDTFPVSICQESVAALSVTYIAFFGRSSYC